MKSICLKPWELAAYMREKKLLVVRPVKPQPEFHSSLGCIAHYIGRSTYRSGLPTKCPFGKPGEVLGIKEAWSSFYDSVEDGGIGGDVPIYKATYEEDFDEDPSEVSWHPAVTMPLWAIRHRPTIADIRVMRVGEIGADDVIATHIDLIGCSTDTAKRNVFASQWMKDHGKDSWASSPWCWFMNVVE
jgi:hypothetical protein